MNRRRQNTLAFTLIEMLVVIAVIGVLATLVIGGMARAKSARDRARVKTELNMLITAIDSYKQKLGFYPPDNPQNPLQPPLFYELTGTVRQDDGGFLPLAGHELTEALAPEVITTHFGVGGFANSSTDRDMVFNFAKNLKANHYAELDVSDEVEVLIVPVDTFGTNMIDGHVHSSDGEAKTRKINPWRYVSTNPTNNPNSFDLWAEIKNGKNTDIIGNW